MIACRRLSALKSTNILKRTCFSSYSKTEDEIANKKTSKKPRPEVIPFMPVINIPLSEFASNAFYSLHRPLLGLSAPKPFKAGNLVGEIKKEESDKEEVLANYMATLKPFQPPEIPGKATLSAPTTTTTTITVEIDPSYFLQHSNNHEQIADYLTALQKELDDFYSKDSKRTSIKRKRIRKRTHPLGFFEKN